MSTKALEAYYEEYHGIEPEPVNGFALECPVCEGKGIDHYDCFCYNCAGTGEVTQ